MVKLARDKQPQEQQQKTSKSIIRKKVWNELILAEILQDFPTLALGTASLIASSICNALLPLYLGEFYFSSSNNDKKKLDNGSSSLMKLLMLVLCGGTSSFLRTACLTKVESRVTSRVRRRLFEKLLGLSMQDISSEKDRNMNTMLMDDAANVGKTSMTLSSLVRSAVSCTYNTVAMFRISPRLCMTSVFIAPVSAVGIACLLKFKNKSRSKQRALVGSATSFAEERLNNIAAVKLCNREKDEAQKYGDMQAEIGKYDSQVSVADGLFMGGIFWFTSASLAAVVYSGRKEVNSGRLTSSGLSRFVVSTFLLGLGVSGVGQARSKLESQLVSAEHIYPVICSKCIDDDIKDESINCDDNERSKIEDGFTVKLDNISFSYTQGEEVLKNVSLTLESGRVLALVGKNGSGKTTLASILAGLYKADNGSITIDGIDIDSFQKKDVVSVVQQEATSALFALSVRDNINYSKPEATDEEIQAVAQISNCESFINDLNGGYSYNIGRGGSRLSGGQRQRICLARALLTNPRVLVLDEPASQLDAEGGSALEDAVIACRSSNRSLLLITHKPTSLKLADKIVVLDEGRIIESGDYSALAKNSNSALCRLMPSLQDQ